MERSEINFRLSKSDVAGAVTLAAKLFVLLARLKDGDVNGGGSDSSFSLDDGTAVVTVGSHGCPAAVLLLCEESLLYR